MNWKSKQLKWKDFSNLQDFYIFGGGIVQAAELERQRFHV